MWSLKGVFWGASIAIFLDKDSAATVAAIGGPDHLLISYLVGPAWHLAPRNSLKVERPGRCFEHGRASAGGSPEWENHPLPTEFRRTSPSRHLGFRARRGDL